MPTYTLVDEAPKKQTFTLVDEPEQLAWSDVPGQALQNAPKSAREFGRAMVQPFIDPMGTLQSLGNLGYGASQLASRGGNEWLAERGLARKRDAEEEDRSDSVRTARAAGGFLKDRYGGVDNIKRTLANDPVGALADISTLFTGGGGLLARAPGAVARAGSKALTVAGNATNPVNAVTKPAGLLAKGAAHTVGSLGTGTGGESLLQAFRAGERGGVAGQVFRDNMRGNAPQAAVVDNAMAAIDKMGDDASQAYQKNMAATKANSAPIDMTPVEDEMQKLTDSLFHGPSQVTNDPAINLLKEVGLAIDEWKRNFPNPTAYDLDRLKVKIDSLKPNYAGLTKDQGRIITTMRNAVKKQIVANDPQYAKTMKEYEDYASNREEIESALSLGGKKSKDTALRKMQSVLRNDASTNYGSRVENVRKLEETGVASNLMPALAGQSLSSKFPRGINRVLSSGLLGAAIYSLDPTLVGGLLASSPRLMGELTHAAGRIRGKVPKGVALPAFQVGRAGLLGQT